MPTRSQTNNPDMYVTKHELDTLSSHFDQRFASVNNTMHSMQQSVNNSISELSHKIDQISKPRFDIWMSMAGLILVIVGMLGAQIWNKISDSEQKSEMRIAASENNSERWTRTDHAQYDLRLHNDLEDLRLRIRENATTIEVVKTLVSEDNEEIKELQTSCKTLEAIVNRIDERLNIHLQVDNNGI